MEGQAQNGDRKGDQLSPSDVAHDDRCDFGKWLHGATATTLKSSPHYSKCVELHRQFHTVAARVLSLAVGGKKDEAARAMNLQGDYAQASAALTKEMMNWKSAV